MKLCKGRIKVLASLLVVAVFISTLSTTALAAPVVMPDGSLFDAEFYAAENPDVVAAYGSDNADLMYVHYVTSGKNEGRLPYAGADMKNQAASANFDAKFYAANNPDVVAAFGCDNAYMMYFHYVTIGKKEGRLPYAGAEKISQTASANESRTISSDELYYAASYYARSVFVGDSVLAGYRNYLAKQNSSPVSPSTFLAAASYSAAHALNANDELHPIYRGKKQPVWTAISQMDVDRVFIMFGTNDLVVKDVVLASQDVLALADRIKAYNPGKEIHIISMSPVYAGTVKGAMNNSTIPIYNSLLLQGAKERGFYYIDLNSHLVNSNGDLVPEYCSDRYVHQTYAAYSEVWDPLFTSYALGE